MQELQQCTVVLDGHVTGAASERVEEALGLLRPGGTLLIDLSQATSVEAVLLARLVRLLQARRAPVSVRILGLRRRDGQLLGYLGLDLAQCASAAWSAQQEDALG
jgi:anti-anti-sigma regulatory factor